ncbi:hypothetical protein GCM10009801_16790 [Streptomyces albiaxialis]|uniref:HTH araC/xylS-type domain-containing protein n=1 Tax=Streptomyces albiaxialis TaxID=329523 RepID=A0ABP5H896_9ACTN
MRESPGDDAPGTFGFRNDVVTLAVGVGGSLRVLGAEGAKGGAGGEVTAVVAGLATRSRAMIQYGGPGAVEILLEPWAAFALFGPSMQGLADSVASLASVLGARFGELGDALAGTSEWQKRCAALDSVLASWAAAGPVGSPQVRDAWRTLRRTGGTVPIGQLAGQSGWCWRLFEDRFRHQTGLTPKKAARTVRLRWALELLARGSRLADIAARCGFSDQAHLCREVKAMTGRTARQLRHASAAD